MERNDMTWTVWPDFDEGGENGEFLIGEDGTHPLYVTCGEGTVDDKRCRAEGLALLLNGVSEVDGEVPVCSTCGSMDVLNDAYAAWSVEEQKMELHSTYDKWRCNVCDGECSVDFVSVASTRCEHEWIDVTNEVVLGTEMCRKCHLLRPQGGDGDEGVDGMETCRTCGERYDAYGDGEDGECPSCADKSFQEREGAP